MRPRVSIAALVVFVAFCGVGMAALKFPSPLAASALYTATVALLSFASVRALRDRRTSWLAFAVVGWAHLLLAFWGTRETTPAPRLLTTYVLDALFIGLKENFRLVPPYLGTAASASSQEVVSYQIALSLMTLFLATFGGFIASRNARGREKQG